MKRDVRLSPHAERDLVRLGRFLADKNPTAARRAVAAISLSLRSLEDSAERGRLAAPGLRELPIRFGRDGYFAQYRLSDGIVVVARIFHARERR